MVLRITIPQNVHFLFVFSSFFHFRFFNFMFFVSNSGFGINPTRLYPVYLEDGISAQVRAAFKTVAPPICSDWSHFPLVGTSLRPSRNEITPSLRGTGKIVILIRFSMLSLSKNNLSNYCGLTSPSTSLSSAWTATTRTVWFWSSSRRMG